MFNIASYKSGSSMSFAIRVHSVVQCVFWDAAIALICKICFQYKIMTKNKPCTLYNVQTNWSYFQELLKITILDNSIPLKTEDDITNAVERFNQTVQQVVWSATPTSSNSEIHIEYSPAIKEKIIEKGSSARCMICCGRLTDVQF